jgi:hypothetical protein
MSPVSAPFWHAAGTAGFTHVGACLHRWGHTRELRLFLSSSVRSHVAQRSPLSEQGHLSVADSTLYERNGHVHGTEE